MPKTHATGLLPSNWFLDMPAELEEPLMALAVRRQLRPNELLYRASDRAEGLYRINSGRVRLSATVQGREFTITYADPGSWIGEVPMLDGLPQGSDAVAVEACEVSLVTKPQFDALLQRQPELYRHFARRLANALRIAVSYYTDLATLPFPARLAKRVLELAQEFGEPAAGGVRITLRLPQEMLAGMMSASRQRLSKELKLWEAQGWIQLKYNTIVVLQAQALQALLADAQRVR